MMLCYQAREAASVQVVTSAFARQAAAALMGRLVPSCPRLHVKLLPPMGRWVSSGLCWRLRLKLAAMGERL
jgi:hypothetical protein